jgi:rhamnosyltransferase
MRRVAVFAHYDSQNTIKRYILRHLAALREVCDEIHFASTAQLGSGELAKLNGLATSSRLCENAGYDFGMWAQVLAPLHLEDCDELVLTNSSVYGPVTPLAQVFARMSDCACDFWGMTDSLEIEYHIQSFFLVFRKSILKSGKVGRFFASVLPYRHKWQVIRSYEVGLTHFFLDEGFVPAVVASVLGRDLRLGACNPCICVPARLLDLGVPYVKVELLRDNPLALRLAPIRARMASLAYPLDLVEIQRKPRERILADLYNRLNMQLQRWRIRGKTALPLRKDVSTMFQIGSEPRAAAQIPSDG